MLATVPRREITIVCQLYYNVNHQQRKQKHWDWIQEYVL